MNRTRLINSCEANCHGPAISHLMFVDDRLLFYRATEEEARNLKEVLERCETCSGHTINFSIRGTFFNPDVT